MLINSRPINFSATAQLRQAKLARTPVNSEDLCREPLCCRETIDGFHLFIMFLFSMAHRPA